MRRCSTSWRVRSPPSAQVREYDYEQVRQAIDDLVELSKQYDNMATVKKMKEIVPEYKSKNSEYEVLDQA